MTVQCSSLPPELARVAHRLVLEVPVAERRTEAFVAVRAEELRRLERCERALAETYRRQARGSERPDEEWRQLQRIAARYFAHAQLLGERLLALGGCPDLGGDDQWILGDPGERETLARAERLALATYHDHLIDHDEETRELISEVILPGHRQSLGYLTRDDRVAPLSEL
jgi:hypothetical protein